MIFVTVGSQLPFDRMIKAVDEIAPLLGDTEIVAQVFKMEYQPKNIKTVEFLSPGEFEAYINKAELVISHAGMGTILSVSQLNKPMIVFPRLGKLKETRNDHQVATCKMLEKKSTLYVAYNAEDLRKHIELYKANKMQPMEKISPFASEQLIGSLKSFINGNKAAV